MAQTHGRMIVAGITAVGVVMIHDHFVPSVADIRTAQPFDTDIDSASRSALVTAVGFVALMSLLSRSLEPFIVGGATEVILDFATKYANAVSPDSGKMAGTPAMSGVSTSYPMPDYTGDEQAA